MNQHFSLRATLERLTVRADRFITGQPVLYWLAALMLAAPVIYHLPAVWTGHYSFYNSYLTGQAFPGRPDRIANFLYIGACLGLMYRARRRPVPVLKKTGLALILGGFALAAPFGSTDWLYYFHLAKTWAGQELNPYSSLFTAFNPFLAGGAAFKVSFISYPPLWIIVLGFIYRLAAGRLLFFMLILKLLLAAAHLLNSRLLVRCLQRLYPEISPQTTRTIAAGYLLHPLILLDGPGMMHYDLLWLCLALLALERMLAGAWTRAVLCFSLSLWLKYSALFLAPLGLPRLFRKTGHHRQRWGDLLTLIIWPAAIGAAGALVFHFDAGIWKGFVNQAAWTMNSPLTAVRFWLRPAPATLGWYRLGLLLAGGGLLLACCRRLRPRPRLDDPEGALAIMVAGMLAFLLLASASFWPWYSLWPLVFSFLLLPGKHHALQEVAESFAWLSFTYYAFVYLTGPIEASSDLQFQTWYCLITRIPPLLLLARLILRVQGGGPPAPSPAPGR